MASLTRRRAALALASAALLALAGCTSSGPASTLSATSASRGSSKTGPGVGTPPIVLGSKNFAEETLLGELYTQALRGQGFTVTHRRDIGDSVAIDKALSAGSIDLYPEYTGVIYTELAHLGDHPASAAQTLAGARTWEAGRGYEVLAATPFQDTGGIAVANAYAERHQLTTIADLTKVGRFRYAAPPENATRYQGVVGLRQAYGLSDIEFHPIKTIGAQYQLLNQGKVDVIAIFSTDGQLASGRYMPLEDTHRVFGFQQAAPVVARQTLRTLGPAFRTTLDAVSAQLTTRAVVRMNKSVQIDQTPVASVAAEFLRAHHLA